MTNPDSDIVRGRRQTTLLAIERRRTAETRLQNGQIDITQFLDFLSHSFDSNINRLLGERIEREDVNVDQNDIENIAPDNQNAALPAAPAAPAIQSTNDCAVCLGPRNRTFAFQCGHLFCDFCSATILGERLPRRTCPICRAQVQIRFEIFA